MGGTEIAERGNWQASVKPPLSLGRSVGGRRKEEEMSEIERFSCLGEMQPNKMNVKGNLSCLLVL